MADLIQIKGLHLRTIIGVGDEERRDRQDVMIDIDLQTDTRTSARSDDLEDSVDYRALTKRIIALVEGSNFHLVEKLASEIASLCLKDRRVKRARITVEKPLALRFARSVGVTVERERLNVR